MPNPRTSRVLKLPKPFRTVDSSLPKTHASNLRTDPKRATALASSALWKSGPSARRREPRFAPGKRSKFMKGRLNCQTEFKSCYEIRTRLGFRRWAHSAVSFCYLVPGIWESASSRVHFTFCFYLPPNLGVPHLKRWLHYHSCSCPASGQLSSSTHCYNALFRIACGQHECACEPADAHARTVL